MTRDSLHILRAQQGKSKKGRRLHSLQELKEQNLREQRTVHAVTTAKTSTKKAVKSPLKRALIWFFGGVASLIFILSACLLYLTSPMGESTLTSMVQYGVNYVGKPLNLRISIANIRGFWQGKIQIHDMRVFDAYGPWLRIEEGTLHPQWSSLARGSIATLQYRHNQEVAERLRTSSSSVATLPQNHDQLFLHDEKSDIEQDAQTGQKAQLDLVDALLTAEDVLKNKVVIGLKVGTLVGVYMPRFPKYTPVEKEEPQEEGLPLRFLPSWFALDIGEVELAGFQLGPTGKSVTISSRIHAQISEKKIRLRSVLLAASKISTQWVLPPVQDLPADITLTISQLRKNSEALAQNLSKAGRTSLKGNKYVLSFASLDYDDGDIDLRWDCRDSFLTPIYLQGAKSLRSRSRFLARVQTWPPSVEHPVQARFVNRFNMNLEQKEQRIKASLASGQMFWDGKSLVVRDFTMASPIKNPDLQVVGSLGYKPEAGFGTQLNVSIKNINILAAALGVKVDEVPLSGPIKTDFYVSRGGKYMLWWAKPLPDFQAERILPGFTSKPYDYSIIAQNVQRYAKNVLSSLGVVQRTFAAQNVHANFVNKAREKVVKAEDKATAQLVLSEQEKSLETQLEQIKHIPLPLPSQSEEGLRFRFKLESEALQVPQGIIKNAFFTIHGTSVHAPSAPAGTNYPRKAQPKVMSDFTAKGLPRGIVGTTYLRFGDLFNFGKAEHENSWFVGGVHDESDVFQARLSPSTMKFPGITSTADLSFAFALPRLKRRWPWVDGNFNFHVENWDFIEHVLSSPMRVNNLQFASSFKSFLDENGRPAQYMNTLFSTDRMDATQFMVRSAMGKTESKNLHALADTVGLSIGNLREALTRTMEYTPPKDYKIFTADIDLSSGRGGPVRWTKGEADMYIAGEDAHFNVKMLGDINALLDGIFHFRSRTLKVGEMKISTPKKDTK